MKLEMDLSKRSNDLLCCRDVKLTRPDTKLLIYNTLPRMPYIIQKGTCPVSIIINLHYTMTIFLDDRMPSSDSSLWYVPLL
jgi:hypothetical protein